jgi:hypothetical protein
VIINYLVVMGQAIVEFVIAQKTRNAVLIALLHIFLDGKPSICLSYSSTYSSYISGNIYCVDNFSMVSTEVIWSSYSSLTEYRLVAIVNSAIDPCPSSPSLI